MPYKSVYIRWEKTNSARRNKKRNGCFKADIRARRRAEAGSTLSERRVLATWLWCKTDTNECDDALCTLIVIDVSPATPADHDKAAA